MYTPGDLAHRLRASGLETSPDHIFTSAMATAAFLRSQCPSGGTAFVIGESGLTEAMQQAGFVIADTIVEYVVLGETHSYNLDTITRASSSSPTARTSSPPTRTRRSRATRA